MPTLLAVLTLVIYLLVPLPSEATVPRQSIDTSWELLPDHSFKIDWFSPKEMTQVEALRPSYCHSRQYRFTCSDCTLCHRFPYCSVVASQHRKV